MRGLCKEEDYAFLGVPEKTAKETTEGAGASEDNWSDKKEERERRQLERERQEEERLSQIEECRKEREQQWRTHVAELTSSQEKILAGRLARLKKFREFQRKVMVEESGLEGRAADHTGNQLLTRM